MKVFLVTRNHDYESEVIGVFETQEKAFDFLRDDLKIVDGEFEMLGSSFMVRNVQSGKVRVSNFDYYVYKWEVV